ncbi:hypothetical protein PG993_011915 [Apiospora rasikravindrae]|uniref:Heterokaryon incompatibility domain-containing protein n=1 Tax=Apiospora rasikravindrae TaxID=990691 RepID=A0ABR1S0Y9_9PEZI
MSGDASCDVEQKTQAVAAGEWLVHLCQKGGALGRALTPLEEKKFNEFFELYVHEETFKHYHIQAVHHSLSGKDYSLAQTLLAKDDTKRLLLDDPSALQIAIKAVHIEPGCLHESIKETAPLLLDTVKLLIEHGAVANSLDEDGNSALFYTCVLGYAELFTLLCESGADVGTTHQRRTPEQLRRLNGHDSEANEAPDGVNLLQVTLDALISPQKILDFTWIGYPPGMNYDYHMWKLDLETTWGGIVLELIRKGLTCTPDDLGLVKLLHVSFFQGALDFVTPLLEFGASINAPDRHLIDETGREQGACYETAIHAAAAKWQIPTAQRLLQHGADPRATSESRSYYGSEDFTPVGLALARVDGSDEEEICKALEFCEMMIQAEISLEEKDHLELLNFCAKRSRLDFLRQLLQRGVRPATMPDTSSLDVILLLLEHGVKIDPPSLQKKAMECNRLAILRWSVSQHGGLLPSDPEGWGAIIFRVAGRRPSARGMLKFLTSDYPGPHVDSVLQIHPDGKPDSASEKTNLLQIILGVEDVETVKIALDAGADPRCPGLPEDALTAFQRKIRTGNMTPYPDHSLQIIRLLQEKMLVGTCWIPPSVTETRAKSKETIDTQKRMWDERIERLVQSRCEIPTLQGLKLSQSQYTDAITRGARHTYPYEDLTGASSMRLLELLPSPNRTSPVEGRLVHSDITHQPQYEALSYVWGDPAMECSVSMDGHPVSITQNLHSALIHLRHEVDVRKLWVDALCINQSNISERNQQVGIMGDIYRRANQVLVWLGEAADDSHLVFTRIREVQDSFINEAQSTEQERRAWKALITRPWFFRTWVIQEVALNSQKTIMICGDDSARWLDLKSVRSDFSSGASGLGRVMGHAKTNAYHPIGGVDFDSRIYFLRVMDPGDHPVSIMRYSRMCQSSDIKDRVYGVLGLFEPGFMTIDYKLPVEEIFRRFVEATIRLKGDLSILQANGSQRHLSSLPSWVPDLSNGSVTTIASTGFPKMILPGLNFRADGALVGALGDTWGRPARAFCKHVEGFAQWYRLCGTGVLEAADPSGYLRDVEFFMDWAGTEAKDAADSLPEGKLPCRLRWYRKDVEYTIYDRRFYVTEGGSMGLAAPGARVGDRIAFIPGAYQPFVLRRGDDGESWTMHGDCYLYGLDVFALFRNDQHLVEEFVIR